MKKRSAWINTFKNFPKSCFGLFEFCGTEKFGEVIFYSVLGELVVSLIFNLKNFDKNFHFFWEYRPAP